MSAGVVIRGTSNISGTSIEHKATIDLFTPFQI